MLGVGLSVVCGGLALVAVCMVALAATDAGAGASNPRSAELPDVAPRVMRGSGDQASEDFEAAWPLMVAEIEHQGEGHFAVTAHNAAGESLGLLANTSGPHRGAALVRARAGETIYYEIKAGGAWQITTRLPDPTSARGPGSVEGVGDDVVVLRLDQGRAVFGMTHQGEGHFAVKLHELSGRPLNLLANESGVYQGRASESVGAGLYLLEIKAGGPWRVDIEQ